MTIILAMMQRHGKFIEPQDVAAAVLTQGADETRLELVRLMAECWDGDQPWENLSWKLLAWTLEEAARTAGKR